MKRVIAILLFLVLNACGSQARTDTKRQAFIDSLGVLPDQEEVSFELTSVEEFDNYYRKTLQYSVAGEPIEAYLLVPKVIEGKAPAIVAIHQDGSHRPYEFGKGEPAGVHGDPELAYGLELCQMGYVVICPDRFGFESRMLSNSRFKDVFAGFPITVRYEEAGETKSVDLTEDLFKGAMGNYYLIEGKTALGMTVCELMAAVDILGSLNEVDTDRIGVIGHSAGGLLSAILMYVDERIKVGCSSCGTFLISDIYNPEYLRPMNGFSGLLTVPGLKLWGDFDEVLAGLYPRPFLETSGDISREHVHRNSAEKYASGGKQERMHHIFYDAGAHIFREDMRERSYAFLDQWLKLE